MSKVELVNLAPRENTAVREFIQRLHDRFPSEIVQTMLFGSKARGDSDRWSDIDILIIVSEESWVLRGQISDVGSDVSLEYDVLIGPRVIGLARWEKMRAGRLALYRNIEAEGIPLTGISVPA